MDPNQRIYVTVSIQPRWSLKKKNRNQIKSSLLN
jgi:hypothetical protein